MHEHKILIRAAWITKIEPGDTTTAHMVGLVNDIYEYYRHPLPDMDYATSRRLLLKQVRELFAAQAEKLTAAYSLELMSGSDRSSISSSSGYRSKTSSIPAPAGYQLIPETFWMQGNGHKGHSIVDEILYVTIGGQHVALSYGIDAVPSAATINDRVTGNLDGVRARLDELRLPTDRWPDP